MPIPANATIRAQIIGGVRAALEAESVADALDDIGQNAGQVARIAVRASWALRMMNRQLTRTFTAANLAATGLWAFSAAGFATKVVALSLATVALPALVLALWSVATAASVVAVALAGGLLAVLGAAGVMALGVIDRFKTMRDVSGSAANDLLVQAGALRGAFRDAIAPGADKIMSGLADGLTALIPLMRELAPAFTVLGGAIGDTLEGLLRGLGGAGPQLSAMFTALAPAIMATGDFLGAFGGLLVQIATVGAPLLADALTWLANVARGWTKSFDTGTLSAAQDTLRGFATVVKTFFAAFAEPLKPLFGPAMSDMNGAVTVLAGPLGSLLGNLVATLFRIAVAVLPSVVKGVQWLSRVLPKAIGWIKQAGTSVVDALRPAEPFFRNVLAPLFVGIWNGIKPLLGMIGMFVKGALVALGWLGDRLEGARGVIEKIGYVLGFIFGGAIIKVVGLIVKVLPHIGFIGTAISKVGGAIQWAMGKGWKAVKWTVEAIAKRIGTVKTIMLGLAGGLAGAAETFWGGIGTAFDAVWSTIKSSFVSVVNFLIGVMNTFISAFNGTIGQLSRLPGIPNITIDLIPKVGDGGGGVAPGGSPGAPPGSTLGDGPRGGQPTPIRPTDSARPVSPSREAAPSHRGGRPFPGDVVLDGRKVGAVLDRRAGDDEDRK